MRWVEEHNNLVNHMKEVKDNQPLSRPLQGCGRKCAFNILNGLEAGRGQDTPTTAPSWAHSPRNFDQPLEVHNANSTAQPGHSDRATPTTSTGPASNAQPR